MQWVPACSGNVSSSRHRITAADIQPSRVLKWGICVVCKHNCKCGLWLAPPALPPAACICSDGRVLKNNPEQKQTSKHSACISCLLVCLLQLKPVSANSESCNDKHNQGSVPGFVSDTVSHGGWPFQSSCTCCSSVGQPALTRASRLALRAGSFEEPPYIPNVKFTSDKGEVSCQIQLQGVCTSRRSVHSVGPSHAARSGRESQRASLCRGANLQAKRTSSLTVDCLQPPAVCHQGLPLPAGHCLLACQAMIGSVAFSQAGGSVSNFALPH